MVVHFNDKKMQVRKSLEKPSRILGMKMQELGIILTAFISLTVLLSILRMFMHISPMVNVISLAFIVGLMVIVRIAERKKHPSFLISAISFYWKQPKRIVMTNPKSIRHVKQN
jgi:hypothetical protein